MKIKLTNAGLGFWGLCAPSGEEIVAAEAQAKKVEKR